MIPYGRQTIDDDDIKAVIDVLKSELLTQGPAVPCFEDAVATLCSVPHAIAVNSATSALHISCIALGVGPGDIVWTSPNTFVASANCVRYCGGTVDFVDIDSLTQNMSIDCLAEKLREAELAGTLPKVVIPVHFAGHPCDMKPIHELGQKYGFKIIEDASHAIGARYKQSLIGDCTYSDITVFSFHPVKIITTAEGGMATTKSAKLARNLQLLRSHGITRDTDEVKNSNEGPWYYEQFLLGYNYRMTDLQAALGVSQIKHIHDWLARRHQIADRYDIALAELPLVTTQRTASNYSSLHLYCIQVESRRSIFEKLRTAGILVNVHYIPVHLQPYYKRLGFKQGQFPNSEAFYNRTISLPIFASLKDQDQGYVIHAVKTALNA